MPTFMIYGLQSMVGLDYAFKISGEDKFRDAKFDSWECGNVLITIPAPA